MNIYMRGFCDLLLKHMENGHSFDTFHATLRYPKTVVNQWLVDKPEFADAKHIGESLRIKTLESLLITKQINLETFEYLTKHNETDIETALPGFDENILIQARERFGK